MNRQPALAVAATIGLCFTGASGANTIFFNETFGATGSCAGIAGPPWPFPAGWARYDVDVGLPTGAATFVDAAWIAREDFVFDANNCVAISTSRYSPPMPAFDFMCTPELQVPPQAWLRWRAVAYDAGFRDGYQVRVMRVAPATGGPGDDGNLITHSTVLFDTDAEETAWQSREVNLAVLGFGNEPLWFCFLNDSFQKFLLAVDDVQVERRLRDLAVDTPARPVEYTRVFADVGYPVLRQARVVNAGDLPMSDIVVTAEVRRNGIVVQSDTHAIASLAAGAGQTVFGSLGVPMAQPGLWTVRYRVDATQTDDVPANDAIDSEAIFVGGDEIARDDGVATGTFGLGSGTGGEVGTQYLLPQGGTVVGVRVAMGALPPSTGWTGASLFALIRSFNIGTSVPGDVLHTTVPVVVTARDPVTYILNFDPPVTLPPNRYAVTVFEPPAIGGPNNALAVGLSDTVFLPGTTWANWPTITPGWVNLESFGFEYFRMPMVSLLFQAAQFRDGFE